MVSKKGYIKTLEAIIAIIIIIMVGYILIPRPTEPAPDVPSVVKGVQKVIAQSIQFNETIRGLLTKKEKLQDLGYNERHDLEEGIRDIIDQYVPLGYGYTCSICSNPGRCLIDYTLNPDLPPPLVEKSIYMTDVLIASGEKKQNPKIIRVWFWKEPASPQDKSQISAYNDCGIIVED